MNRLTMVGAGRQRRSPQTERQYKRKREVRRCGHHCPPFWWHERENTADQRPIPAPHRRMIEDMTVRNFVEKTRNDYIRHVRTLIAFLGRSSDIAAAAEQRHHVAAVRPAPV